MTQQHLYTAYVGVVPHEVDRKAVPERVRVHSHAIQFSMTSSSRGGAFSISFTG